MRLFITGIGGFLGSRLAACWLERGHAVAGTAPSAELFATERPGVEVHPFDLGRPFEPRMFAGVETVLHCAHDLRAGNFRVNVEGTRQAYTAARNCGATTQVYISSYSARPDAASEYGRVKYALEQFFLEQGQTIARPGLVLGYGGLFGRNLDLILRLPVMPLVDGGDYPVPVIGIGDFVAAMTRLVETQRRGAYNLFYRDTVSFGVLVRTVNRLSGRRVAYCNVPAAAAEAGLRALARLGLPLSVGLGSLKALQQNRQPIHESHLSEFLESESSLESVLREALDERRRARRRK